MKRFYIAIAAILVALVVIVALQNTEVVTIKLLAWEISMSRFVLLMLATASGFVGGFIASRFVSVTPK